MKYLFIAALFFITLPSYSQLKFSLNGKVPNGLNHAKAYLKVRDVYSNNYFEYNDSAAIVNGAFRFNAEINKPAEKAILIIRQNGVEKYYLQFVVDSGINNLVIKKVSANEYENKFKNVQFINSKSNILNTRLDSIYWHNRGLDSVATPGLKKQMVLLNNYQIDSVRLALSRDYPNEYYSLIVLRENLGRAYCSNSNVLHILEVLNDSLKSTKLGVEIYTLATKRIKAINSAKAGSAVREFSVKTDGGKLFSNKSLLGKPYVIAFSATWCIPCQEYQKKLLSLYQKYKDKGLEVVYFNLDDNTIKWKKHIKDKNLDWINVSEGTKFSDSKIARMFDANAIPLYIVVDKKGLIAYNADELHDDNYTQLEKYIRAVTN